MKKNLLLMISRMLVNLFTAQQKDFANYAKYAKDHSMIKLQKTRPAAVFMGDSITEF